MKNSLTHHFIGGITRIFRVIPILFAITLPILASCQGVQNLPFETIYKDQMGDPSTLYKDVLPGLLIITTPDQIDQTFKSYNTMILKEKLKAVDLKSNLIVVIFRGWLSQTSTLYIPEVQKVTREGNLVTVHAHFGTPKGAGQSISSPFTVIKISKLGNWSGYIDFKLNFDEEMYGLTQHFP